MAFHFIHTLWNGLRTWSMVVEGSCTTVEVSSRDLSNNYYTYIRATSYHWSQIVVYMMSECTLAHVHGNASATSIVMELRLLSLCYSTILCKHLSSNIENIHTSALVYLEQFRIKTFLG